MQATRTDSLLNDAMIYFQCMSAGTCAGPDDRKFQARTDDSYCDHSRGPRMNDIVSGARPGEQRIIQVSK